MKIWKVGLFIDRKKLDFEMAKKIPVSAVLSFWSIKGIAIPLSSRAKKFLFINRENAYFSKRIDFSHINKPFKKPVNSQRAMANALLKKILIQIVPMQLRKAKASTTDNSYSLHRGLRSLYTNSKKPCFLIKYALFG